MLHAGARTAAIALMLAGCRSSTPVVARPSPESIWRYEVVASRGAEMLEVDATFPVGSADRLVVDGGAEVYVDGVTVDAPSSARAVSFSGKGFDVPECRAGCRLHWRVRLREAALAFDEVESAAIRGETVVAAPSVFLLRPAIAPEGARYRLHVRTAGDLSFVTGVFPVDGSNDTYEAFAHDLVDCPFSAFGPLRLHTLDVDDAHVTVAIPPGLALGDAALLRWTQGAARAIGGYYGRFPIPHALVLLVATGGDGVGFGQASGGGGATILARLGVDTSQAELDTDWVLPHEMVHLAMPYMQRRHHWFEEGLATYIEPIARARAGQLSIDGVWKPFLEMMHHGLPVEGDEGLDGTRRWGRIYWGGAIFCLLADVRIREQTGNARSLDVALRAIVDEGANISVRWDLRQALEAGDRATGTHVLTALHDELGSKAVPIDLGGTFKRLGVSIAGDRVAYDDQAELAVIRRAIDGSAAVAPSAAPK
jgi:predicted metalloprotease with PDZ domain